MPKTENTRRYTAPERLFHRAAGLAGKSLQQINEQHRSDAARTGGVLVEVPPGSFDAAGPGGMRTASDRLAYHATVEERLPSIQRHGLVPGSDPRLRGDDEPSALFLSDDLDWVRHYGSADVYLRFPFPKDASSDRHPITGRVLPHQFMSFKTVSPASIEILEGDAWVPLMRRSRLAANVP